MPDSDYFTFTEIKEAIKNLMFDFSTLVTSTPKPLAPALAKFLNTHQTTLADIVGDLSQFPHH